MTEISGISGGGSAYSAGSGKIPVSGKEESPIIKSDAASTGENVDVEKLQAEYKQVCEMKAQLESMLGKEPGGKDGNSSVMDLIRTAVGGGALGVGIANSKDIKELKGEFAEIKGKGKDKGKPSSDPSSEPALTKKELKALNWVKKKAFFEGLRSVDDPELYVLQGMAGTLFAITASVLGALFITGAGVAVGPALLAGGGALLAAGAVGPAVIGQVRNGLEDAERAGEHSADILQNNSEKESLPRLAKNYGEYIKSEKDRKLFYGE